MHNDDGSIVVKVERPNVSVRLGLAIDCGLGIADGILPGGAFDMSTKDDPKLQAKIHSGVLVLHSVDGIVMTWGSPSSLQIVAGILGDKTSFELCFTPSNVSKTEIAVLVTRPDETTSLGISLDPASGRVLQIAADGPTAGGIKANYEPASIDILVQKYMLVAIDGARIDWASGATIEPAVAGKKQLVFCFDEHPDFRTPDSQPLTKKVPAIVSASPPQPPSNPAAALPANATPDLSLPLHVRRPELYRPLVAVSRQTISTPTGSRYIARAASGEVIADILTKRKPYSVSSIHSNWRERIIRKFADGTTEVVELEGGKIVTNTVQCPVTQEIMNQNKVDSCFGRFDLVTALVFKTVCEKSGHGFGFKIYQACVVCSLEQKYHVSDGSCVRNPEDAFAPKSHMSCGLTQGTFDRYTKMLPPDRIYYVKRHPDTNELLCNTCRHPVHAHPKGAHPPDSLQSKPPRGWLPEHGPDTTVARRITRDSAASGPIDPNRGPFCVVKTVTIPLEGWFEKFSTGGLIKNWQRRYFTLQGGLLKYYVDKGDLEGDLDSKGLVPLHAHPETEIYPNPTLEDHSEATVPDRDFLIIFKDYRVKVSFFIPFGDTLLDSPSKLLMRAPTAEEKKKWVDALVADNA